MSYKNTVKDYSQMIGYITRDKTSRDPSAMDQEPLTMDQEPRTGYADKNAGKLVKKLNMDYFRHGTRSDDPTRLKKINDYVENFEKDYGIKPTAKNIRTNLNEQRRVIPFYEEEYGKLPKGKGTRISNVQNDVVKILKDPKIIAKLEAGKFPTITDVSRITKLDATLAETRLVDLAEKLRDNPKYKTIADNYFDKPGVSSKDEIFGGKKGKRSRVILENRFSKLMELDQKLPSLRTNILRKIQSFIPDLKGLLSVDEIAGITSSMRRGSGPYAIFGQVIGLKVSDKPPSETIKNKKIYTQYKDLFDDHYKKYGYSFEVPADRDSLVDISKKLDNKSFQNIVKNRFKSLIGKGGKIGALAGLGTLAGTGFALADEEVSQTPFPGMKPQGSPGQLNPETEEGLSTGQKTAIAGGVGVGAYKFGKPIAKAALKGLGGLFGPVGVAASYPALGMLGEEYKTDLSRPLDRVVLGAELAGAKGIVSGAQNFRKGIKNPLLRKIAGGITSISPKYALKAARVASPLGIASLAGEGLYHLGKAGVAEKRKLNAMTDREREDYMRSEIDPLMDEGGMLFND